MMRLVHRVGGIEAVVKMAQVFGGKNVYFPKTASDGHPLVVAMGRTAAEAVMKVFGGHSYDVPQGISPRIAAAVDVLQKKGTLNQAATAAGMTRRSMSRVRAKLEKGEAPSWLPAKKPFVKRADDRQIDMDEILSKD
jgi:hypothetical protein